MRTQISAFDLRQILLVAKTAAKAKSRDLRVVLIDCDQRAMTFRATDSYWAYQHSLQTTDEGLDGARIRLRAEQIADFLKVLGKPRRGDLVTVEADDDSSTWTVSEQAYRFESAHEPGVQIRVLFTDALSPRSNEGRTFSPAIHAPVFSALGRTDFLLEPRGLTGRGWWGFRILETDHTGNGLLLLNAGRPRL